MSTTLAHAAVHLAETLSRENQALTALDFAAAAGLLNDKTRALAAFSAAEGDAAVPAEMRRVAEQLRALVAENRRLLERAMLVQGRVIGTIARAAPRAWSASAGGYRRDGAMAGTRAAPAVALSARA